jgi:hypothetical protein
MKAPEVRRMELALVRTADITIPRLWPRLIPSVRSRALSFHMSLEASAPYPTPAAYQRAPGIHAWDAARLPDPDLGEIAPGYPDQRPP